MDPRKRRGVRAQAWAYYEIKKAQGNVDVVAVREMAAKALQQQNAQKKEKEEKREKGSIHS